MRRSDSTSCSDTASAPPRAGLDADLPIRPTAVSGTAELVAVARTVHGRPVAVAVRPGRPLPFEGRVAVAGGRTRRRPQAPSSPAASRVSRSSNARSASPGPSRPGPRSRRRPRSAAPPRRDRRRSRSAPASRPGSKGGEPRRDPLGPRPPKADVAPLARHRGHCHASPRCAPRTGPAAGARRKGRDRSSPAGRPRSPDRRSVAGR